MTSTNVNISLNQKFSSKNVQDGPKQKSKPIKNVHRKQSKSNLSNLGLTHEFPTIGEFRQIWIKWLNLTSQMDRFK